MLSTLLPIQAPSANLKFCFIHMFCRDVVCNYQRKKLLIVPRRGITLIYILLLSCLLAWISRWHIASEHCQVYMVQERSKGDLQGDCRFIAQKWIYIPWGVGRHLPGKGDHKTLILEPNCAKDPPRSRIWFLTNKRDAITCGRRCHACVEQDVWVGKKMKYCSSTMSLDQLNMYMYCYWWSICRTTINLLTFVAHTGNP